ncbi:MAG: hypothetical protein PHH36_06745 [Sideroxydans sp.]|nr:hypothetical protein [Sideroxydans sp.]
MKKRFLTAGLLLVATILPMAVHSLNTGNEQDARTTGCLPRDVASVAAAVCASCHKDAPQRFGKDPVRSCTPYCMSCHKKTDMDRHHTVGTALPRMPETDMYLTAGKKVVCSTCHDLSRPRYDLVRWKATSLFDRMFHDEDQYKTYFLSMRNDQGQLCLTCH